VPRAELENPQVLEQAVAALWPNAPQELRYRLDQRDPLLRRALELNYHRSYDLNGRLTDHFWMIDLPFLTLFWVEFLARWYPRAAAAAPTPSGSSSRSSTGMTCSA